MEKGSRRYMPYYTCSNHYIDALWNSVSKLERLEYGISSIKIPDQDWLSLSGFSPFSKSKLRWYLHDPIIRIRLLGACSQKIGFSIYTIFA